MVSCDGCQVDTLDEAIALTNANEHGNGTAIFTRSGPAARQFQSDIDVGMVGVTPLAFSSCRVCQASCMSVSLPAALGSL